MKGAAAAMLGTEPLFVVKHAAKRFRPVRALADGTRTLSPAEGQALVSGDGVGRCSSLKISAGVRQPDSGRMVIDARSRSLCCAGPYDARNARLSIRFQEPTFRGPTLADQQIAEARFPNAVLVIDGPVDSLSPAFPSAAVRGPLKFPARGVNLDDQHGPTEGA